RTLGGGEHGHRLAAPPDVVELAAHERGEDAAAPVSWQHRHPAYTRQGERCPTRQGQLKGVRARGADDAPFLDGDKAAVQLEEALGAPLLKLGIGGASAKRRALGAHKFDVLIRRCRADLEIHGEGVSSISSIGMKDAAQLAWHESVLAPPVAGIYCRTDTAGPAGYSEYTQG